MPIIILLTINFCLKNICYTIISKCSFNMTSLEEHISLKIIDPMDTNNIIDSTTASTILKWAITILVAGFIAQFGKKFANFLTEKIKNTRKKKSGSIEVKQGTTHETAAISPAQPPHSGFGEADSERARLKLEKKKAKAAAKEQKKKS
jgi:hypothetical protein